MKRAPRTKPPSFISYAELTQGKTAVNYDQIGKVSAASVQKCTGKNWAQWIPLLAQAGAGTWTYQEIVAHLKKKHRLTPWWQQGVAMGFEIATGRRKAGQDIKGKYMVTATKSLQIDVQKVWKFLLSPEGLEIWLKPLSPGMEIQPGNQFETTDGFFGEVRTIAKGRRARLYWQDPEWAKHTVLELMLVPKPSKRSLLVFNHTGIHDIRARDLLKTRWRQAADRAAETLKSRSTQS